MPEFRHIAYSVCLLTLTTDTVAKIHTTPLTRAMAVTVATAMAVATTAHPLRVMEVRILDSKGCPLPPHTDMA